ncbi:MAG: malto-oligosyltrehalose synthase, partial [Akkermansiaceae bacterium]|nr:malto-oligosyltrehalose synthase [Verrucomicrobiales bacterium]
TYLTAESLQPSPTERAVIEKAITEAQLRATASEAAVFPLLKKLLTLELLPELEPATVDLAREFVLRFQQLTGPVMAKGLEDTAFYNYNRLISLNEVGGDPAQFGVSVEEFHNANSTMAAHWPHTLLATASHDTKRGEDARARINVLSEIPDEWHDAANRWSQWNADKKVSLNGHFAPSANEEYLFYQSLVSAWPVEADQSPDVAVLRERTGAFMLKAMRESKANTNWLQPHVAYETAVRDFIGRVLADDADARFRDDLEKFTRRVACWGRFNSLSQTLLKITSPGVPDFYQGTELWDLSFVDPDNRRPVDFELRRSLLADLKRQFNASPALCAFDVLASESGAMKLFVLWRALELRNRSRAVLDRGSYLPLPSFGARKDHVCGFARTLGEVSILTLVPRLICGLTRGEEVPPLGASIWEDTLVALPDAHSGDLFRNAFTGETIEVRAGKGSSHLKLADMLRRFPVALLESVSK